MYRDIGGDTSHLPGSCSPSPYLGCCSLAWASTGCSLASWCNVQGNSRCALRWVRGGGQVLRLVLGKGLKLALAGSALGLCAAFAVARMLAAALSELPAQEPLVVLGLTASLASVAMFACWLPARRAASLDPMVALRRE